MIRITMPTVLLLLALSTFARSEDRGEIGTYDLTVEHLRNPIALDTEKPRLSWKVQVQNPEAINIQQKSYRVLVASSEQLIARDKGDLWDSGRVTSPQSILVSYQGQRLTSRQHCFWKVQITDTEGRQSGWSDVAEWEMGLLKPADWSGSHWIGLKDSPRDHRLATRKHNRQKKELKSHASPLLRKQIFVKKPVRKATAYVSGIGYSEFYLNGNKVGDHVLDPGQTNYEKLTFYVPFDVTALLKQGDNALGVWLGNGFYGQNLAFEGGFGYGKPSVRAKLFVQYEDGTTTQFVTDKTWKAIASPIVFDNVYWGESYDARLEVSGWSKPGLDDSSWQSAVKMPAPCSESQLRPQLLPPIKVVERIEPVAIRKMDGETWLLDFGKNIAGWVNIKVNQKPGDTITINFSEVLEKNTGRLFQGSQGGGSTGSHHMLAYVCKGGGEESWSPRFTYSGFRYAEISGLAGKPAPKDIQAIFARSAVEKTGSFSCSNELFNQQYQASLLSMEGNIHSLPEDCPHREKCGWLGDAHATTDLCLYNYDIMRFYLKYMEDIKGSLTKGYGNGDGGFFKVGKRLGPVPDGLDGVPTFVAPGKRTAGLGSVDWGVAYLIMPWQMYLHSGDVESFKPHFENIKDFISYYRVYKTKDGVIDNGLGDWCPPRWASPKEREKMECHPHISGTAYYFLALKIAGQMAEVLGDKKYQRQCLKEAEEIRTAFSNVYLEKIKGTDLKHFGSQTATAMALKSGLVDSTDAQKRVDALVHDIKELHDGHHSCGIHGLRHLYTVLADHGRDQLVFDMLTDTSFPSPAYVLSCGLTTWPERCLEWKKTRYAGSFNHPMNGGFAAFMHESLGGIRPLSSAPGFKRFVLKPSLTEQLGWVKTRIGSPFGPIGSEWKNESGSFSWKVEIPPNTTATLHIPCSAECKITETNHYVEISSDAKTMTESQQLFRQVDVGSGIYNFVVK